MMTYYRRAHPQNQGSQPDRHTGYSYLYMWYLHMTTGQQGRHCSQREDRYQVTHHYHHHSLANHHSALIVVYTVNC